MNAFRRTAIFLVACICGWFVMELEILGVRILAPYFGSAVYVVTGSVIGVFLLSLAVGYILGGWFSRREKRLMHLGQSIVAAGLWIAVLPFADKYVCEAIFQTGFDEKWGSLTASLVLFGLPTVLLGTVSPIVIRSCENKNGGSGFTAGLVLAGSTIASFAGCVVTAFYLVLFSLSRTLTVSGSILMIVGISVVLCSLKLADKAQIELPVQRDEIGIL